MNEDMRLKNLVVKGPKAVTLPCLLSCSKSEACPCQALQNYYKTIAPGDVTSIELEWMHVPTRNSAAFWMKLVFPIIATVILVALFFVKFGSTCPSVEKGYEIHLSGQGYNIKFCTVSVQELEKVTNEVSRIKRDLKDMSKGD